jgi:N-carbamoyl-L-amino-acid hydrolase
LRPLDDGAAIGVACRPRSGANLAPHHDIINGAGHDAVCLARIAPAAMVFAPCVGGISRDEIEERQNRRLTAGCNVLLNALLDRAVASSTGEDREGARP